MPSFRDNLIRAHFEAHRDLTWAETLEPRFREQGVAGEALEALRQAWNKHVEKHDWAWWQENSKRSSNAELDYERMDCIEKLDAIGMLQWRQDKAASERASFQEILKATPDREEKPQEQSKTRDNGREI